MRKKQFIRVLATALAFALLLTVTPVVILAQEQNDPYEVSSNVNVLASSSDSWFVTSEMMKGFRTGNFKEGKKVYFGMNGSDAQEWWIVGQDPVGGGLVLFAASDLGPKEQFYYTNKELNRTYQSGWGDYGENSPSTISNNHYGGSILRDTLKKLETDSDYFSLSEQNLMMSTTIATKDKQNNLTYTTTDKLYAVYDSSDPFNPTICTAGTNTGDNLYTNLLIVNAYWKNSEFWLREPGSLDIAVKVSDPQGNYVITDYVNQTHGVRPAFQLDLSSVLFASSAKVATSGGNLATSETFTLRYKDSNNSIGSVSVDALTNTINVENAKDGAYLVVQNSKGAWAQQMTEKNAQIDVSTININGESLVSSERYKVWLEYTSECITKATMPIDLQKAPTPDIKTSQTASTITVKALPDQDKYGTAQYKLMNADSSEIISDWKTSNVFDKLKANTTYTVYAKYPGNDTYLASAEGTETVTTSATYSLTIQASAGGQITLGTSGSYEEGARIDLKAEAETGYTFTGWTSSNGGTFANETDLATTFTMHGNPTTVTANFKLADVAPGITGETSMNVAYGYEETSSSAFFITGNPKPSVTIDKNDNGKITWNDTTNKLDIAQGLAAGVYPVVLTASNGVEADATLTFTLTVLAPPTHEIIGSGNTEVKPGEDYSVTFRGDFKSWETVRLNGVEMKIVAQSQALYYLTYPGYPGNAGQGEAGSVKITLYKEFLATLPAGVYKLKVEFEDGGVQTSGETEFRLLGEVKPTPEPGEPLDVPPTGDSRQQWPWALMLLTALVCGNTLFICRKKEEKQQK